MDFVEKLREYFNQNTNEQIRKDLEKSKEFDDIKPTVDDFLKNNEKLFKFKNDLNPYSPTANWIKP